VNGAIIFSGRYGSTAQYARWISEATGLPVFDIRDPGVDPTSYDLLVLGSSVVFYRATIRRWVKANWPDLQSRDLVLFTVSGAPPGPKLEGWIARSFPEGVLARMPHVALRGRLRHEQVSWWLRIILRIGALMNRDPEAKKDEMHGFDYMDPASIEPIVRLVQEYQSLEQPTPAYQADDAHTYGPAQGTVDAR
jgi:menaquinone-dependent protoporphyrinogen IX oxidase